MRDSQKSCVYAAGWELWRFYDFAVKTDNHSVEIGGSTLQLPPEAKFGTLEAIQTYCDKVTDLMGLPPVKVRSRKQGSAAHYEWPAVIAIHTKGSRWAMRELVVLHELAHHMTRGCVAQHGPEFVANFIELLSRVMGPEAGLAMRLINAEGNVRETVHTT